MNFVFSKLFYVLLVLGFLPLSLSWGRPVLRWATFGFDLALLLAAFIDAKTSKLDESILIKREFNKRFAVGGETEVQLNVINRSPKKIELRLKDEYPEQMILSAEREGKLTVDANTSSSLIYGLTPPKRGKFGLGLVWVQTEIDEKASVKVYPNLRRAREAELKALGARSLVAAHRRSVWRGEGREFESMRDYVRGDELRHISWTATARRGKLVTKQYQIERDQTILIALDAGRLMTGRIENESKLDLAVHAALALMSAAARGGDNSGLVVFGRHIKTFIPPKRGIDHIDATLEALHDIQPEMIEPSYSRAFEFIAVNCKKRALVVVLTDLIDEEGSKQLLTSLKLLRPRHLPLVVTIGDRDLRTAVGDIPQTTRELFTQSIAEEILHQRETALRMVESQGGLALDVTAVSLVPSLLETYIRVKERGLL
jgi:uncharacterized protein (DUF58 family)